MSGQQTALKTIRRFRASCVKSIQKQIDETEVNVSEKYRFARSFENSEVISLGIGVAKEFGQ